jgi:hypothetical protein
MFAWSPSEAPPTFYEQMFASAKTPTLAQRTLGALRLTRSFLLLEDDYDVDWEVDRDEALTQTHPHRAPLRGQGRRSRRGGQGVAPQHICLSPVNPTPVPAYASRKRPACARSDGQRSRH